MNQIQMHVYKMFSAVVKSFVTKIFCNQIGNFFTEKIHYVSEGRVSGCGQLTC